MFSEGFVARINLEMNGLEVSGSVNRSSFHSHFEPMRSGLDPGTGQTCGHIEGDVIAIKDQRNISVLYTETPNATSASELRPQSHTAGRTWPRG